ncbi:CRISPR-associated helicase/endonuclease Cas3 [Couchioplanes caeruleus subsp. caeruleus]|uniref:CRISPR-associated helicase/endonuclease Cas3 n=1 Tax=Couchioplanes caeruleus subsp. caeruleus TaxID=56427 RepID=A0A1K0FP00_9ACTN|nr:CRISPR-associated helicase/endonuclease Cas3 [Couchioplanes caeruleus subsp. caeruleus]
MAGNFAAPFGGQQVAYWLGRLHDVGKASCTWQAGLARAAVTGGRVGTDHKALGTRVAHERGLGGFAVGIWGHHSGLVDMQDLGPALKSRVTDGAAEVASAEQVLDGLVADLPADLRAAVPPVWREDRLVGEMAVRLCFSALVDADFLDTAAHFAGLPAPRVRPEADLGVLYERFTTRRAGKLATRRGSPIDALRERIYAGCVEAAERPAGIFRLAAPTGAGKTFASAGFALRHGHRHGKRRVIVAVPFLTITEQNALQYRELLDDERDADPVVLEHHSGVDFDAGGARRWARLAAENWDAPFIVTTFVRLFESLYARKPAAVRRLHRLADSVIVLDEVQALPPAMLMPILDGLRLLVQHFGVTVLLCSATQPDFWALSPFAHLEATDLITDLPAVASRLRRVSFEWQLDPSPTLAGIAAQAAALGCAMVVVNTTADAQTVFAQWRHTGDECDTAQRVAWHLSTRMCPDHRRRVLAEVRRRLDAGLPVLLVSTQLIEAGVDIDFPVVFRALAPADSLLQAAGRANREGRLAGLGRVVIFAASDARQPPSYRAAVGATLLHFGPGRDPDDVTALPAYYRSLYDALNLADPGHVGQRIQQARTRWAFETVASGPVIDATSGVRDQTQAFRMIDDDSLAVITPQAADPDERQEVDDALTRLRDAPVPAMGDVRRLQPYTTTLNRSVLRARPHVQALLRPVLGTPGTAGALVEWCGDYDDATGITIDTAVEGLVL